MTDAVRAHYERYPYPVYPLLASVRRCDTYAINQTALWCRFNRHLPPDSARRILLAGCGSFSPYPWAVSNPDSQIVALDLSQRSLERARLHCLLHRRRNVQFRCGDLLDARHIEGEFGIIDAFGVLHHLDDPLAGLTALCRRLVPGGIIRIMLYSRYARREEEAIRRALRILGVRDVTAARTMLATARPGSRLARFARAAYEIGNDAGLADALLHPRVHTYRIDDCMELVRQAGLTPLMFAHNGACADIEKELSRLRQLERERLAPDNFIIYLGNTPEAPVDDIRHGFFMLNPCLASSVGRFRPGSLDIPDRLGRSNHRLGFREKALLRRFLSPRPAAAVDRETLAQLSAHLDALFLLYYF